MLDPATWRPIQSLDLSPVKQRLRQRKGAFWAIFHNVDRLEAQYRQFLYLVAANPGQTVVPWSEPLDDFWHEHILDTRRYDADCVELFGHFLHHNPHLAVGTPKQVEAFRQTKSMYRAAFGDHDRRRPHASADTGCGSSFPMVFCSSDAGGHGDCGHGHGDSGSSCGSSCSSSCGSSCGGGCGGGCGGD